MEKSFIETHGLSSLVLGLPRNQNKSFLFSLSCFLFLRFVRSFAGSRSLTLSSCRSLSTHEHYLPPTIVTCHPSRFQPRMPHLQLCRPFGLPVPKADDTSSPGSSRAGAAACSSCGRCDGVCAVFSSAFKIVCPASSPDPCDTKK